MLLDWTIYETLKFIPLLLKIHTLELDGLEEIEGQNDGHHCAASRLAHKVSVIK